jgi:hypothetical protein
MHKILLQLLHLVAIWALNIWLLWNSDWLAQQIVENTPIGAVRFGAGWVIGLSAASWPLALEVAVERWQIERDFDSRAWILFTAGGLTLLGIGTIAVGLVGGTLDPKAPSRIYMFCGLLVGGLTGAVWWVWRFIQKGMH